MPDATVARMGAETGSTTLARLSIVGRRGVISAATRFVHKVAADECGNNQDGERFEHLAEEAALNVVQHAYGGDESAVFDIVLERRPGQFVLAVEDHGIPFDPQKCLEGKGTGIGLRLIKAFSDEVRAINLGRGGKRLEFVRKLAPREPMDFHAEAASEQQPGRDAFPTDMPLEIRLMRPEDGVELARCMYRSYGYSYAEEVYFPERVREMIQSGLRESLVAFAPGGEMVGHLAMTKDAADARVGEIGQAIVDPRCRGRRLFERMKAQFVDHSREGGMYGLYSEAVTVHTYSQQGNHALGATETGILLADVPQRYSFKDIDENLPQRLATVLFYLRVNPEPERVVYPPFHHHSMVRRIYETGGFRRTIRRAPRRDALTLDERSTVNVHVDSDGSIGTLRVLTIGADVEHVVRARLHELRLAKLDCVYLDLPLSNPAASAACAGMEALGFVFAGVVPELLPDGDALRLQYLNNVAIDPSRIALASAFAKDMLAYIVGMMGRNV